MRKAHVLQNITGLSELVALRDPGPRSWNATQAESPSSLISSPVRPCQCRGNKPEPVRDSSLSGLGLGEKGNDGMVLR
jgi:hypothetical protein